MADLENMLSTFTGERTSELLPDGESGDRVTRVHMKSKRECVDARKVHLA